MKLTICFDDISLPLPPMEAPDIRQMVIETVLDMAADAGVDDVDADRRPGPAPAHDRGRAAPRAGRPRLRRLRPPRPADPARRRGPRQPHPSRARPSRARTSRSTSGPPPRTSWSTSTSTWWPWTAGTRAWPPGWPATSSLRHHHNPQTMQHSRSFMDAPASELHSSNWRMGRFIAEAGREDLPDRDHAQHRHLPVRRSPSCKSASGSGTLRDRATFAATSQSLGRVPPRLARQIFHSIESPARHDLGAGRRGRGRPRHHDGERVEAAGGRRAGPDRHPHPGAALHLPLQRELDHEPDPGGLPRVGLLLQPLPGQAPGARGRRADPAPPDPSRVPPRPPPELHRLLRAGADPDGRPGAPSTSSSRSRSPPTRGTSTSTAPVTPITACIPSTCGTGARTRWSIWGGSSSSAAIPRPCAGSASPRPRR